MERSTHCLLPSAISHKVVYIILLYEKASSYSAQFRVLHISCIKILVCLPLRPAFLTPLDINLRVLATMDALHQGKDCQRVHRDAQTWKLGCMVPVVTQSPSEAYPMGGLGLQKVSPRSEPSMLVSMMAPAGPTAGGWLLHICTNIVVRATGLQGTHIPHYTDCVEIY